MNNHYQLDQGSIIYGIKSSKYPNIVCYGIIITASCDIANSKVSKYYYLLGIDVDEWLKSSHCFHYLFSKEIDEKIKTHTNVISNCKLDAEALLSFSKEEVEKVIKEKVPQKKQKIESAIDFLRKAKQISTITELSEIDIKAENKITGKLKEISQGREAHYYYLPKSAYLNSDKMDEGLIIDLQEIGFILPEEANIIIRNKGIDSMVLSSLNSDLVESLKSTLFLEDDDSYVDVEGTINSPWREHLMQRFSQGFIRIGLDGANDSDFKEIAKRTLGG